MTYSRRKYSAEYKREAIALTQQPNTSIAGVARSLGINAVNLRHWIKEAMPAIQRPLQVRVTLVMKN